MAYKKKIGTGYQIGSKNPNKAGIRCIHPSIALPQEIMREAFDKLRKIKGWSKEMAELLYCSEARVYGIVGGSYVNEQREFIEKAKIILERHKDDN